MHTVMDKSEAMHHEACIPESWWEFSIAHATHVYNHTPLRHHNWQIPFEVLHRSQPDIAHLHVFGCAAYMHLPEDVWANKMAPKSELMMYIGVAPGNKSNFLFMRSPTMSYSHPHMHYSMKPISPTVRNQPACNLLHRSHHPLLVSMSPSGHHPLQRMMTINPGHLLLALHLLLLSLLTCLLLAQQRLCLLHHASRGLLYWLQSLLLPHTHNVNTMCLIGPVMCMVTNTWLSK